MRLEDTISKCSASVTILADGRECPEYDIKGDETGNLCCYIPLMSDQVISVQISLDMTSEHFEVDLFTDGVIRNFWQSTRNAVNRHRAPNVEFTQGIYKDGRSLYRANMTTIDIPNDLATTGGTQRTNVGLIEIQVSKVDEERNVHYHGAVIPDDVSKAWYETALGSADISLIKPTLQMMFKHGIRMQEADRGGTRIRLRRTRQGAAPWGTFKFFYRERADLRASGISGITNTGPSSPFIDSVGQPRKRRAESDDGASPEIALKRSRQDVHDLRAEVLELQMQADRAKKARLAKERQTEELARQSRKEWAELELAKADLERQLAEDTALAYAQEQEQQELLRGFPPTRFSH